MDTILVTGGCGFIGSHIIDGLIAQGHMVVAVDNYDPYYDRKIKEKNIQDKNPEKLTFYETTILKDNEIHKIIEKHSISKIVHMAAQAGVRASLEDPVKTFKVNTIGTCKLIKAAIGTTVKKIVYASSSSVYGRVEYLPFDEKHPKNPISPYGVSKLSSEYILKKICQRENIEYSILRYFTVYGPRIRPDLAISIFTKKALKDTPLIIYGDGEKTRDFTFIQDAVDATLSALKKGQGTYNIGGGTRQSINKVAEMIINTTKSNSEIEYMEDATGDMQDTYADTTHAKNELGWKPKIDFKTGLKKTVQWIKENE